MQTKQEKITNKELRDRVERQLDWEPEVVSVGAQIVGHGVLGRGLRACAREGHAGQVAEAGRGEQPQRVPALSPAGAHLVTGVEDDEVAAAAP